MEEKNYKYDAFISYRHCELDKYVAENLHRILESYDLPKSIKKKLNVNGKAFKRIFRDQEELPLSSNLEDPIIEALKESKYLIVICSPRLKDSLWCKKEIQTFKKLRGRKNIFCVLVEGEPSDSFPEEVLFDEEEVIDKKGKVKKEKKLVEPLAADVRGENKKEVLKKIKEEKLRLIAPMYNLDYDDLKQRHKLRRQKQIITTVSAIAIVLFLFTIYTSLMLIKINSQQKTLKLHQASSLSNQAISNLKDDNRYEAVKSAYEALTSFDGVKMPYTTDAEYSLVESLGLYDVGASYKAISELKTDGVVKYIKTSYNNKYGAIFDESNVLTLFETKTLKKINSYVVNKTYFSEDTFSFIGDDKLSFLNEEGGISIVNASDGKVVKTIDKTENNIYSIKCNSEGYMIYLDKKTLYVYNVKDDTEVGKITTKDRFIKSAYYSEDMKYFFAFTEKDTLQVDKVDYLTLHVIKVDSAKEINEETFQAGFVAGISTKDDNAYLLLNNSSVKGYNMLAISYNYIKDTVNWSNSYDKCFGKFITRSYANNTNNIAIVNYQTTTILNASTGKEVDSYNADSEIINIFSYNNKELYLVFIKSGHVNYINEEQKSNIEIKGQYELNLSDYADVTLSEDGFIMIPFNDNRIILYEQNYNKDMKETDKVDEVKANSVSVLKHEEIFNEYDIKNKSLVERMFYDTDNKLLFVNYTNRDLAIYNTETKALLKTLSKLGKADKYYGKDSAGRIYIGDISDSYILDTNYDKVGHIQKLHKVENDNVIIKSNDKYYTIKIYNLDEILQIAKDYLEYKK